MKTGAKTAVKRDGTDRYPVFFRPDCDRTYCDGFGRSEGLAEMMVRLDKRGWDLVPYPGPPEGPSK